MAKYTARKKARKITKKKTRKKPIESYDHKDKRCKNNPPVGLVTPATDPDRGKRAKYRYDPHLDPQLVWAGKAEHTSFEVPTVSLPFGPGDHNRVAVKIIDDRGIESLRIIDTA